MPHIKSVRLVNVHFNNATQFYDDFMLELGGKNTTYDLENGGGKSLLLLMILQTVLPKTYLRGEKPVSLLFQGGKDRTSHVAVEWILEEGGYKYLLTGFSARKRKSAGEPSAEASEDEKNLQAGDIEHLNWCVFYNDDKISGTKSVPLVTGESGRKAYANFEDIRKYVQQLRQKGLPAEVFDTIEQYQRYISAQSLIAAEWNIIRGINSGENNIESYFRQDATSRKLIENRFVKIVEDMETMNKGSKQNNESVLLADTLIEIRSRLNEYLKLKGHMAEYDKIKSYYTEFSSRNDDLLGAFQDYEEVKRQAAAIRNRIGTELNQLEQEKTAAFTSLEYNTASSNEGKSLKKLLAAGLVNYEKEKLLAVKQQWQAVGDKLAARQGELKQQLDHLLALEAYGDYRTDKQRIKQIEKQLQIMAIHGGALQADYKIMGGKLKLLTNRRLAELEEANKKCMAEKVRLTTQQKQTQQTLLTATGQEAVLAAAIAALTKEEQSLADKQQKLNEFFLQRGETEALLFAEQFLGQAEDNLTEYIRQTGSNNEEIKSIDTQVQSLKIKGVKTQGEINKLFGTKQQQEKWLTAYQDELAGLKQKAAAFGKSTLEEYCEGLELLLNEERLAKLEKEIEAGRLRQKKQLSEARGYYVPNEAIVSLAEKLDAKCEFVQPGIDWIAKTDLHEKEHILRTLPYLPFSVLVDRKSFAKLKSGRLKLDFASDYPVPVVNVESVRLLDATESADVYYICSIADLVLHNSCYEQYVQGIENVLAATDSEIDAIEKRIEELGNALSKVAVFHAQYPLDKLENAKKSVETLANELTVLGKQKEAIDAEISLREQQQGCLQDKNKELLMFTEDCRENRDKLIAVIQTGNGLTNIREQLSGKRKEHEAVTNTITSINAAIDELTRQYSAIEEKITGLLIELNDINKVKEQLASFTEIESSLAMTQAQAEYKALHEAVSGKVAEENELRSQMNDCAKRLSTLKNRIKRDYGRDLEEIEKSEENKELITIPSQTMIEAAQLNEFQNNAELNATDKKIKGISIEITRAEVRLEELLKDFPAEVKSDLPVYNSEDRYKQEIETVEQLIKSYEQAITNATEELEEIRRKTDRLSGQAEDYDVFIERERVVNEGTLAQETKDFRLFEKEYYTLRGVIQQQCEKWDNRIKTIGGETGNFIIREPLEELAKIEHPATSQQCVGRQQAFAEYTANLEEQMRKISSDIVQLESYQQDFTRRCIQRAELVLGHLRKLESLSRIEVYGRRINMIELKLQEFEEKEKYLRMQAHINGIVREIGEEGAIDRKRIVAKLAVKELLAQIADMEKAVVRLYKIESVAENSKFYRWENAIGSEGQNNSLYFIFAACLISFIRMLSIANSSIKTRKVIIADNPFGATTAVYLWDPMFKILKQNDVQLIAPGHRIPREITSRFGVSYLLNQEILEDGRMRVVVKDVRVEEDENVMRYVEPEQLSMFMP